MILSIGLAAAVAFSMVLAGDAKAKKKKKKKRGSRGGVAFIDNTIRCENQDPETPECEGTNQDDRILGTQNKDEIDAKDGRDIVRAGKRATLSA